MDENLQQYMLKQHSDLICTIEDLLREIKRLKEGRFTPEEFQNLCHTFSEEDKKAFCIGCVEYQKKLFGESPIEKLINTLKEWYEIHKDCAEIDPCIYVDDIKSLIEGYEK